MRRFGGKGLVTAAAPFGGTGLDAGPWPYYDFGIGWVPLVCQRRPRYVSGATFTTRVFDGREPACVWHRLMLDGCIPPETAVQVSSRAADDRAALADAPWQPEPPLYLRDDGSELPYAPVAATTSDGEGPGRRCSSRHRGDISSSGSTSSATAGRRPGCGPCGRTTRGSPISTITSRRSTARTRRRRRSSTGSWRTSRGSSPRSRTRSRPSRRCSTSRAHQPRTSTGWRVGTAWRSTRTGRSRGGALPGARDGLLPVPGHDPGPGDGAPAGARRVHRQVDLHRRHELLPVHRRREAPHSVDPVPDRRDVCHADPAGGRARRPDRAGAVAPGGRWQVSQGRAALNAMYLALFDPANRPSEFPIQPPADATTKALWQRFAPAGAWVRTLGRTGCTLRGGRTFWSGGIRA